MSVLASIRNNEPKKDDENIMTFQKEGYLIFVGLNAFSNEKLVADHGHNECLWMHALAARGGHVILCLKNKPDPSEDVIQYAAKIALKNSHSEARTVCVAILKDVHKPEGGGVGVWRTSRPKTVEVL